MPEVFTWPVGRAVDVKDPLLSRQPAPRLPIAAFVLTSTVAGTATALLLATGGKLAHVRDAPMAANWVAGSLAVLAIWLELRQRVAPLPQPQRQVPRAWTLWPSRTATGAAFGAMIGAGVLTFLQHATIYILGLALLAAPSMAAAAFCGAVYGFTRAAPVPLSWVANVWFGRRIPWHRLTAYRGRVSVLLAAAAVMALSNWI